jgi:hypothetical protein
MMRLADAATGKLKAQKLRVKARWRYSAKPSSSLHQWREKVCPADGYQAIVDSKEIREFQRSVITGSQDAVEYPLDSRFRTLDYACGDGVASRRDDSLGFIKLRQPIPANELRVPWPLVKRSRMKQRDNAGYILSVDFLVIAGY